MSVNYDLYETPDLAKSGEEQPLHARVVLKGSYTAEEFVEQVTVFQHMPHAQVVGVIEAISKELRHLLLKVFSCRFFARRIMDDTKAHSGHSCFQLLYRRLIFIITHQRLLSSV